MDSIPGSGRSPGEGNGRPLQYSCLENSMDWGAWRATVHEVTKIWTWLNETHMEKEMQPTPVLFPGKLHGLRSLVGYSPWGCKESDTTERLHYHYHFTIKWHTHTLQCKILVSASHGSPLALSPLPSCLKSLLVPSGSQLLHPFSFLCLLHLTSGVGEGWGWKTRDPRPLRLGLVPGLEGTWTASLRKGHERVSPASY